MSRKKKDKTILGAAYERFAIATPVAVMARAAIERCLSPQAIDQLFHQTSHRQYTLELFFSTTFKVLAEVVLNVHRSVHSSWQARAEQIGVSVGALYDKLANTEPQVSAAVVRHSGRELGRVLQHLGGALPSPLPGREVRILDGNCPEATERRLQVQRGVEDRPLPGRALAVLDPAQMLILDALPCEDGHASERSLIRHALPWVRPGEVWIADRMFCVWSWLEGVVRAGAYFVVRQHGQFSPEPLEDFRVVGRNASGLVSEQRVRACLPEGRWVEWRRICVQLDQPTRDGQREVFVLTNLPLEEAAALKVAELYLGRWTVEHVFQEIEASLSSEINTLGYPGAALLGLCLGFVAYNVLALITGAMRAAHGAQKVEQEVSFYYLSEELENTHRGLHIAVPPETWEEFRRMSPRQMARELLRLAKGMNLLHYKKHPRGPKKPKPKRKQLGKGNNVSTARLLLGIA
jgi:hypothetical protein